ncbi:MAG TPA: hypothetical protein VFA18_06695, partial [Gemmataceae bacterium]|nr:hypothetical protein [Gemmataceae bacterium]
ELRLPLQVFPWQPAMRRPGLVRGALLLVRPDGYVAMADPHAEVQKLRDYFRAGGPGGSLASRTA